MYTKTQLIIFTSSYIFLCVWIFYGLMQLNKYFNNKIVKSMKEDA